MEFTVKDYINDPDAAIKMFTIEHHEWFHPNYLER